MSESQKYQGVRAVARRLGVSAMTANRLLRARRIGHTRIGSVYRVSEAEIRAFEARNTFAAAG